jgi:tetratricopeptide (TPR) repeat protein
MRGRGRLRIKPADLEPVNTAEKAHFMRRMMRGLRTGSTHCVIVPVPACRLCAMPSRLRLAGCLLLFAVALRTDAASKPSARTALVIGNARVEASATNCELILHALRDCLPPDHAKKIPFTAKALNRRGDALLLLGRADEALDAYNAALPLAPEDAYILYNRGRAYSALGSTDNAKADFTAAASDKFKSAGAKKLCLAALAKMK